MMVSNRGSVLALLRWQSKSVLIYAAAGGVAAGLFVATEQLGWPPFTLPIIPLSIVGAALGIFVSFRTNSAYDRWWEGRKLWGRLINTSRMFSTQALAYLPDEVEADRTRIVHRHAAYVHVLRCLLRRQDPLEDEDVAQHLSADELEALRGRSNMTHWLLDRQQRELVALSDAGHLDPFRLASLDRSIMHLLDIQGGCERIKKTPLPRGYGFIAETLILYFSLLFPFTIVDELHLLVIPANVLVCLSFSLISEAGRVLEDPFTLFWNGLPLMAMSRTIDVNVMEVMGVAELPPLLKPDERGILM